MRWEAKLVALALGVAMLTAGCIGSEQSAKPASAEDEATDPLAEPRFDTEPVEVLRLSMPDGKTMENAIYKPDTDEPVPVFINFSPYWGDSADERGDGFAQYMIEEYVPRGYAVVLASIRGTGHSEGCFQIGGDKEVQDLKATIEHFANVEWSNGNVIAGGKSYDSTPQNGLIAKDAPEGLAGIFHVSGITDMYRYTYRQGVPYAHGAAFNSYYYLQGVDEYGVSITQQGEPTDEDPNSLARLVDDAACPELAEIQANGVGTAAHGMKTDYWLERDWNRYIEDSDWNGSVFFVHGLQDWNVKPDHIQPWLNRLPEDVKLKAWLHQDTYEGTGHVYPMRADWNETMLRWLEHVGKEKDTGVDWGFEVESSDDVWRESETWPPKSATEEDVAIKNLTAYLSDTGRIMVEGPLNYHDDNATHRYAGQPTVDVEVIVKGNPDPVFTAVLYDEAPDGTRTWVNEGVLRGIYRNGLTDPQPFPQDEHVEIEIPLYPQDDVLEPGHKWVVVWGAQPRHAQPTEAQLQGITYTDHGGHMHFHEANVSEGIQPQPEDIGCFAC